MNDQLSISLHNNFRYHVATQAIKKRPCKQALACYYQ